MIYATEKTLKEYGEKVSEAERKTIAEKIEKLRSTLSSETAAAINQAKEELMQASHKLAEEIYKQASAQRAEQAGTASEAGTQAGPTGGEPGPKANGAVDADFEVVDDDKSK
jgi:molecular chaperone DnaK